MRILPHDPVHKENVWDCDSHSSFPGACRQPDSLCSKGLTTLRCIKNKNKKMRHPEAKILFSWPPKHFLNLLTASWRDFVFTQHASHRESFVLPRIRLWKMHSSTAVSFYVIFPDYSSFPPHTHSLPSTFCNFMFPRPPRPKCHNRTRY